MRFAPASVRPRTRRKPRRRESRVRDGESRVRDDFSVAWAWASHPDRKIVSDPTFFCDACAWRGDGGKVVSDPTFSGGKVVSDPTSVSDPTFSSAQSHSLIVTSGGRTSTP